MRRTLSLLALFLFIGSASAQVWVDFGLHYAPNSSMLINSNIQNDNDIVHEFKFANSLGGKIGLNVGDYVQFNFGYAGGSMLQRWRMNDDAGNKFWREFDIDTRTFSTLMRVHAEGTYFEIGPEFTTVRNAFLVNSGDTPSGLEEGDVTALFGESYVAGVFGFGAYLLGNGNISLILGFRASYAFTDALLPEVSNTQPAFPTEYKSYDDPATTNPLTISMMFELNYDIGYLVSPHCKTRSAFLFF